MLFSRTELPYGVRSETCIQDLLSYSDGAGGFPALSCLVVVLWAWIIDPSVPAAPRRSTSSMINQADIVWTHSAKRRDVFGGQDEG